MSLSKRDQDRRLTVGRYHQLKDREDDFEEAKAVTADPAERQRLMDDMAAFRQAHRLEDVARQKRPLGGGVMMQQIMWVPWIQIAVEQELVARRAHVKVRAGDTSFLVDELRASLVATAAAASTIEALVEELKYLIPERPQKATTAKSNLDVLNAALGLENQVKDELVDDLKWLFARRNEGVHPYAEIEEPQPHPAGLSTDAMVASKFNAMESGRAVNIALGVIGLASTPSRSGGRWVARWAQERSSYHGAADDLRLQRNAEPLP